MIRRPHPHAPDSSLYGVSPAETGSQITCLLITGHLHCLPCVWPTFHPFRITLCISSDYWYQRYSGFRVFRQTITYNNFISINTIGLLYPRTPERLNPFTCHRRARHQSGGSCLQWHAVARRPRSTYCGLWHTKYLSPPLWPIQIDIHCPIIAQPPSPQWCHRNVNYHTKSH